MASIDLNWLASRIRRRLGSCVHWGEGFYYAFDIVNAKYNDISLDEVVDCYNKLFEDGYLSRSTHRYVKK